MKTHVEYDDFGEYMEFLEDADAVEGYRFQVREISSVRKKKKNPGLIAVAASLGWHGCRSAAAPGVF